MRDVESKTILLVEDSPGDVFIFKRMAQKAGIRNPIHLARTGPEVIDYLSGSGNYADRNQYPLPILTVLDLKLPLKSGFEVLEWIREVPEFRTLDVIVLTSSSEVRDIERARKMGILSYFVKPPTLALMLQLSEALRKRHEIPGLWPPIEDCLLSKESVKPSDDFI